MSFARGWGKDGWKHRQEDMMRNTWDIFRIKNRTRIRKSKIENIFNEFRKER